jgi:hypothetical protein
MSDGVDIAPIRSILNATDFEPALEIALEGTTKLHGLYADPCRGGSRKRMLRHAPYPVLAVPAD